MPLLWGLEEEKKGLCLCCKALKGGSLLNLCKYSEVVLTFDLVKAVWRHFVPHSEHTQEYQCHFLSLSLSLLAPTRCTVFTLHVRCRDWCSSTSGNSPPLCVQLGWSRHVVLQLFFFHGSVRVDGTAPRRFIGLFLEDMMVYNNSSAYSWQNSSLFALPLSKKREKKNLYGNREKLCLPTWLGELTLDIR